MMRSLYAGVSGLQNHQTRMDVVGNNIANVNTTGFKKGRVNFQDMLSQTTAGAAKPTDAKGGVNPKQVGLGMVIASIDTIHTQGSLQTTGNNLDLAISGNGFFILKDGEKSYYTRAGAFSVDKDGTVVNPGTGLKVQGWTSQDVGGQFLINASGEPGDITIPLYSKDAARATQNVDLKCNLFSENPVIDPANFANLPEAERIRNTWTSSINVFDSEGTPYELRFTFFKVQNNEWQSRTDVFYTDRATGNKIQLTPEQYSIDVVDANGNVPEAFGQSFFNLRFDNMGRLISAQDSNEVLSNQGPISVRLRYLAQTLTPDGAELPPQMMTLNVNLGEAGRVSTDDRIGITQFSSSFTTKPFRQDGFGLGYLETFKIDDTGTITGVFSNGNNRVLAQVAMANFINVGGLEKAGETNFVFSNNSGEAEIGTAGSIGLGKIMSGALEMSNVDLSEQFTDMIVTQRGFQANSKTIQTSDQMLQELLQLKR